MDADYYRGKGISSANGIAVERCERSEQKSELATEKLGEGEAGGKGE